MPSDQRRQRHRSRPAANRQSGRHQGNVQRRKHTPHAGAMIDFGVLEHSWQRWLDANQETPQPLDRWLKRQQQLPVQLGSLQQGNQPSATKLSAAQRWQLNAALIKANRFQQLAAALEAQFRQEEEIDWLHWDQQWQPTELNRLNAQALWYWIGLRAGGDWMRSRHQLRDTTYRERLYAMVQQQALEQPLSPLWCLWHGVRPQWLALLKQRANQSGWSDKQLQSFIKKQCDFPPLWLRLSPETDIDALAEALQAQGIDAQLKHINGEQHLAAYGGQAVQTATEYKAGAFEIQDLASQQIAAAVDAKAGDKVWDACAGAGGKSLAIAARMSGRGSVTATDLHEFKLNELKRRAKRAQIQNIRTFSWDGQQPLRLPAEIRKQQGFDWVLVDAPCTSAGTWRRNPDARWRFNNSDTRQLQQLQQQLLQHASDAVRPGGHLVYATCSWQVAENEHQVEQFLSQHPQFELLEQCMLGAPDEDADCMFYAKLQRQS